MDYTLNSPVEGETENFVFCQTVQGPEIRGTLVRLTRFLAIFEVYQPAAVIRVSEVLNPFQILMNGKLVYKGRAVVSNFVSGGAAMLCEATLEDGWVDVDLFSAEKNGEKLRADFEEFFTSSQKAFHILPEFKLIVADMQTILLSLRSWLEQVELGIRGQPSGDRSEAEKRVLEELEPNVFARLNCMWREFEEVCRHIEPELEPAHRNYLRRQLHPITLCAPFMYRTLYKPLGYAGDYEMVNMILRSPYEGGSLFAKMLNGFFLTMPPAVAHRNRITYLTQQLNNEALRAQRNGRPARIYNLGCGPAKEIQNFLRDSELCNITQFTLLDFNDETLNYAQRVLHEALTLYHRKTPIQLFKKSVAQVVRDAAKPGSVGQFDLVYCAGLFDYLPDQICDRLSNIFFEMLNPGGLLIMTNVEPSNPARAWIEYCVEWNLIYRDQKSFARLAPRKARPGDWKVQSEATGLNLFLEVRKPANG